MFTITEIAALTGGAIHGSCEGCVNAVSTDSRTVEPGQLFVPLRGERFDGHDFVEAVANKGITVVLVEESYQRSALQSGVSSAVTLIAVPDTLAALGDLAAAHRRRFTLPVVAITGKIGRASCRERVCQYV